MITHLELDNLECSIKWTLGSITMNKASGGDGIPAELSQVLKDEIVKVLHSICQQIWITQQWPWDWKRSVFIPIPKKGNAKECSNYWTIALTLQASKVMLNILQTRLQQYMNWVCPEVQAGFRKGRESRDQIANINWMGIPDHLICLLRNLLQDKKQQLELDMEQPTGSKLGKEYFQDVYCHLTYLTYMHSTSCEILGWMKHKLKSRLPGEISITSDIQMTPPLCRKQRGTKEPLDETERGEWKKLA